MAFPHVCPITANPGYIVNEMRLEPDSSVGTVLAPELVNEYTSFMRERLRAGSVHEELRRLRTGLSILLPGRELGWLNALPLKPTRAEIIASRKPIDRPDAARVLDAAYRAFDAIPVTRLDTDTCQAARNCLLVAFCILLDVRLGDLSRIRLGEHLRRTGPRWRLMFLADVKNDALLLHDVPPELAKRLEVYLATFRKALLGGRQDHGALWVGRGGRPLLEKAVAAGINKFGQEHFGRGLNSHVFRHVFASTTVVRNPADADLAAAALGHTTEQMVHGTYTRSAADEISRIWLRKLSRRRRGK